MKKFLLIIALVALGASQAQAQKQKPQLNYSHEFALGYGVINNGAIYSGASKIIGSMLSLGLYVPTNISNSGAIHAGYKYVVSPVFRIGGTFAYAHANADVYTGDWNGGVGYSGKMFENFYSFAAEMEFRYLNRPVVSIYSALGLGATIWQYKIVPDAGPDEKASIVFPDFQLSLIGVKVGKKIGGFVEFGLGYKGVVNFGVYGRL